MADYEEINKNNIYSKVVTTTNPNFKETFARFGPGGCFLPVSFADHMQSIQRFPVRPTDIWLVSFMKTGTTWLKELVWLLMNDLDFTTARSKHCYIRFPNFENSATVGILKSSYSNGTSQPIQPTSMDLINSNQNYQRLIHTHLPWSLLPESIQTGSCKPKIIYITRNPKDVAVSYYHHRVLLEGFLGTMDDFVELFVNDAVRYAPYWHHVKEFWKIRHDPNTLFLTYEQMKSDLSKTAEVVAKFLGKSIDPERKQDLLEYLTFESMKNNAAVNHEHLIESFTRKHGVARQSDFIRKGRINSWEDELSENAKQMLGKWCAQNCMKEFDSLWNVHENGENET